MLVLLTIKEIFMIIFVGVLVTYVLVVTRSFGDLLIDVMIVQCIKRLVNVHINTDHLIWYNS